MGSLYIKDVKHTARCYIGYEEGDNNWTIFAQLLDSVNYFNTPKQNVAWCMTFLCYIILVNCIPDDRSDEEKKWDAYYFLYQPSTNKDNFSCAAYWMARYFQQAGAWHDEPEEGDFIFFKNSKYKTDENPLGIYHGGIVDYVENGRVYTIEGNKNDEVEECDYSLKYNAIAGYGRPRYDGYELPSNEKPADDQKPEPTPEPEKPADEVGETYTVCVRSWLNVRNGCGTEYPVVDKLHNGETVEVYEKKNGWGRISTTMDLWVCMDYLK